MADTQRISEAKAREGIAALKDRWDKALDEYKSYVATIPRRPNVAQRERAAYLKGQLAGVSQAYREFEMRSPVEFYGS